jgi:hypothetical protein
MGKRIVPDVRHVYFIEAEGLDMVKIGFANDARARLRDLQCASPVRLILKGVYRTDDAAALEAGYHERYAHLRQHGEWFRYDDDLRRLANDAFEPEDTRFTLAKNAKPGGVTVSWGPDDTEASFTTRLFTVGHALHPDLWDPPSSLVFGEEHANKEPIPDVLVR